MVTSPDIAAVKGMPDILPEETRRWRRLESIAAEVFAGAGFGELRTPIVEHARVFAGAVGEGSDIVRKEMYTFDDLGGRRLALRPEGTAGVVRAFLTQHMAQSGEEIRVWYSGPMYRYERPQKGRQRQFHQIGVEVFGNASSLIDVEMIALNVAFLTAVGVTPDRVLVNSLGDGESRARYRAALVGFVQPHATELCDDCRQRLELNPLRLLDCKIASCRAIYADAPQPITYLDAGDAAHFREVLDGLAALAVPAVVAPTLVRGLDYYTRTVFEIQSDRLGAQDTVSAGGRYDHLVEAFGGSPTPAFGFAVGVERLLLCGAEAAMPAGAPRLVWVALDETARREGLVWIDALRRAGLAVQQFSGKASLKAQLRAADAIGATHALLRGESERAKGIMTLKPLRGGEQRPVLLDAAEIKAAVGADLER